MSRRASGFIVSAEEMRDGYAGQPTQRVWLAPRRRWTTDRREAHIYRSEASARTAVKDSAREGITISPAHCPQCKGTGYAGGPCPILCDHAPITHTRSLPPTKAKTRTLPTPDATGHQPLPTIQHTRPSLTIATIDPNNPKGMPLLPNDVHREARNEAERLIAKHPALLGKSPLVTLADTGEVSQRLLAVLVAVEASDKFTGSDQAGAGWLAGYVRVRIRADQAWPLQGWPLCLSLPAPAKRAWHQPKVTAKTLLERQRQPSLFS